MKKRTSIIIGIIALILDQLTKVLFVNKNMELIPNVLKIYYWQNEGTIFEITNGIKISDCLRKHNNYNSNCYIFSKKI